MPRGITEWRNRPWPVRLITASLYWDVKIAFGGLYYGGLPVLPVVIIRRFKFWLGPPSKERFDLSVTTNVDDET